MLCMLIESILPLDYYSNMVGALLDQKVFNLILEEKLPELSAHLSAIGIEPSVIVF